MSEITLLLQKVSEGKDPQAEEALLNAVYNELRIIARAKMAIERPGHTLQPTILANDAWLKIFNEGKRAAFKNRAHFFGAAAKAMRNVLIDHARHRLAIKRGGRQYKVQLSTEQFGQIAQKASDELLEAVDDVLKEIHSIDPTTHAVVELSFFLNINKPQIAKILGISLSSVERLYRRFKKTYKPRFKDLL